MTKKEKKSLHQILAEWKLFLYNPTTGEFLGRTAKSWGERAAVGRRGRPRPGGGAGRGRAGKERREAAPRAGPREHCSLRCPQRFSSLASGLTRAAAAEEEKWRGAIHFLRAGGSLLAWETAGPAGSLRWPLPPGRERDARAAQACRPQRRRKPGTLTRSGAPGLPLYGAAGRPRPGGGGRRRRAVRGSQTLPRARGEEISTPSAIL